MNPLRHSFINSLHATHPPPLHKLRYLDVGCGGGIFAESAARLKHTASVTGLDPTPEVVKVAEAHMLSDPALCETQDGAEPKLRYVNKSIEELKLPQNEEEQYDVLALWEVIEHISHPAPFLESCMEFVRPGGWLVGSSIARTWTSWATTKLVAEDLIGIVPRGTHDWEKYINDDELAGFFATKQGWSDMKAMGCIYAPGIGWKMVPGSEKWGNYFFAARRNS